MDDCRQSTTLCLCASVQAEGAKQPQEVSPVTGRALAIASSAPSTIRPVTMCERMLAGKVQVVQWCSSEMSQAQRVRGEERIVIILQQLLLLTICSQIGGARRWLRTELRLRRQVHWRSWHPVVPHAPSAERNQDCGYTLAQYIGCPPPRCLDQVPVMLCRCAWRTVSCSSC